MQRYNSNKKYNKKVRAKFAQNYIKNPSLARKILKFGEYSDKDIVLEVGIGEGVFTKELARLVSKILAIDIDKNNTDALQKFFQKSGMQKQIEIINEDALKFERKFVKTPILHGQYKLFSSVPYNISSQFVKKYLLRKPMPKNALLILQKEFAERALGKSHKGAEGLLSVLLHSFYTASIVHNFKKTDFSPQPSVDSVLVVFNLKKDIPEELLRNIGEYKNFVRDAYVEPIKTTQKYLQKFLTDKQIQKLSDKYKFKLKAPVIELKAEQWMEIFKSLT